MATRTRLVAVLLTPNEYQILVAALLAASSDYPARRDDLDAIRKLIVDAWKAAT